MRRQATLNQLRDMCEMELPPHVDAAVAMLIDALQLVGYEQLQVFRWPTFFGIETAAVCGALAKHAQFIGQQPTHYAMQQYTFHDVLKVSSAPLIVFVGAVLPSDLHGRIILWMGPDVPLQDANSELWLPLIGTWHSMSINSLARICVDFGDGTLMHNGTHLKDNDVVAWKMVLRFMDQYPGYTWIVCTHHKLHAYLLARFMDIYSKGRVLCVQGLCDKEMPRDNPVRPDACCMRILWEDMSVEGVIDRVEDKKNMLVIFWQYVGSLLSALAYKIFFASKTEAAEPNKLFGVEFKTLCIDCDGFEFLHNIWIRLMHVEEKNLFFDCLRHLDNVYTLAATPDPDRAKALQNVHMAYEEAVHMRSKFKQLADFVYANDPAAHKKAVILENSASIYDLLKTQLMLVSNHAQELVRNQALNK